MKKYLIVLALFASACGGSSPTAPTATMTPPIPIPTIAQLSGHLTATNGGQSLANATITLGALQTATNASGDFISVLPLGSVRVTVTGANIFPRSLLAAVNGNRTLNVDAITQSGFDANFYREMIRNTSDAPKTSELLRRWTRTPQIYLKTVDEAGEAIHPPTLDLIESTLRAGVPLWTSNILSTPTITRGTGTMLGVPGWITVRFPATVATTFCGQAQVGMEGGYIDLSYHAPSTAPINCRMPGFVIAPRVVLHELGHALGFWHTDSAGDVMFGGTWNNATQQPSARELYHAAIAYHRPVGNREPDDDPTSSVNLTAMVVR